MSPLLPEHRVRIAAEDISEFCRRWGIRELSLFGSVLRDDFTDASDVDVLVSYASSPPEDIEQWIQMQAELSNLLGRQADIVNLDRIRNPFRRREIERTRRVIYAA